MKKTILAITLATLTTNIFSASYVAQAGASCEALEPLQQIGLKVNDVAGGVQVDLIRRALSIPAGSYFSFRFSTTDVDANQVAHFKQEFGWQYHSNEDERDDKDRYQFDLDLSHRESGIVIMKHYEEFEFYVDPSSPNKGEFILLDDSPCSDIVFKRVGG